MTIRARATHICSILHRDSQINIFVVLKVKRKRSIVAHVQIFLETNRHRFLLHHLHPDSLFLNSYLFTLLFFAAHLNADGIEARVYIQHLARNAL